MKLQVLGKLIRTGQDGTGMHPGVCYRAQVQDCKEFSMIIGQADKSFGAELGSQESLPAAI